MIEFRDISQSFSGVPVLRQVSFSVSPGQTLGLVGENGAGKSTLMNILGGNIQPDGGQMQMAGQPYAPRNPQAATRRGVAFIHQELNLFANLSIAENIHLTAFPTHGGLPWIHREQLRGRTTELLHQVGLSLSPDTLVDKLSAGERQLVEIAKALSIDARLIIFDEPTTSLTTREAERLFELIGRLHQRGLSLIYISHHLGEVLRLCDEVAVLRDGELVARGPVDQFTVDRLVALMVGRNLNQMFPPRTVKPGRQPVLEVQGLSQPGMVKDIHFTVHEREVLGLAGLMGSGRSELARILFGLDPCAVGEIRLAGQRLAKPTPRRCIRRGLAFLTENRREDGLCLEATIADNMALVSLPAHVKKPFGLLRENHLVGPLHYIRDAVRLNRSARNDQPVKTLSGGNQQKVVLAKWLLNRPKMFILDEPTRGIDVGAKYEIYGLINALAEQGAGVLVISSEIEELLGLCDRLLVMNRGEIRDELERPQFDRERILRSALTG